MFGCCDGHGVNGHHSSDHVKKYLPKNIIALDNLAVKQAGQELHTIQENEEVKKDDIPKSFLLSKDRRKKYAVISEGFIKTSVDMQKRPFDINYSGTTTVTVMVSDKNLVCANVGDSRAILGSVRTKKEAALIKPNQGDF